MHLRATWAGFSGVIVWGWYDMTSTCPEKRFLWSRPASIYNSILLARRATKALWTRRLSFSARPRCTLCLPRLIFPGLGFMQSITLENSSATSTSLSPTGNSAGSRFTSAKRFPEAGERGGFAQVIMNNTCTRGYESMSAVLPMGRGLWPGTSGVGL